MSIEEVEDEVVVFILFACAAFIWLRELTIPSVSYRGLHIWRLWEHERRRFWRGKTS